LLPMTVIVAKYSPLADNSAILAYRSVARNGVGKKTPRSRVKAYTKFSRLFSAAPSLVELAFSSASHSIGKPV
jgi:hypothetical protein